jgi:hypothetical protein
MNNVRRFFRPFYFIQTISTWHLFTAGTLSITKIFKKNAGTKKYINIFSQTFDRDLCFFFFVHTFAKGISKERSLEILNRFVDI